MNSTQDLLVRNVEPRDLPRLLTLLLHKAEFDGALQLFQARLEDLERAFFGAHPPQCEALVAESTGQLVGFATHFPTFSTFLARPGIWLDDLFVEPEHRGRGVGLGLLRRLAELAKERGCARIEWTVARDNMRGISFYQRWGARLREDGRLARLDSETIAKLTGS